MSFNDIDGRENLDMGESRVVPLTRCVLCDFEFSPEPFHVITIGDVYGEVRLWVSWCDEHRRVICPVCNSCQAVEPTPGRCARARERRESALQVRSDLGSPL